MYIRIYIYIYVHTQKNHNMETHVLHLQRTNQSKAGWEGVSFSWLKAPQSRWQRPPVGIVFTPTLQDENTTACGRQHQHVQVGAFHVPGIRTNQMSIPTPWSWARSALGCCSLCNGRFAVHETPRRRNCRHPSRATIHYHTTDITPTYSHELIFLSANLWAGC